MTEEARELDTEGESSSPEEEKEKETQGEEKTLESLKQTLSEEKEKAEQYLANWQRTQADFLNLKRRTEQERNEVVKFSNETLITNLLQIMDDLERALQSVPKKLTGLTWVDGVALIYHKFQAILESHGLSRIKALGEDFDPKLHEAVLYSEGEEGKVIEEFQKGYMLHDKVIRPSMVQVGKMDGQDKEGSEQPISEKPINEEETKGGN